MPLRDGALALALLTLAMLPRAAGADGFSLVGRNSFLTRQQEAPIMARLDVPAVVTRGNGSSLFVDRSGGLFAPYPKRIKVPVALPPEEGEMPDLPAGGSHAERIRHIIAAAEAGKKGYDAIQHAAKRLPDKLPTEMTLGEIDAWIRATPGQPHAIGRYQFIPATLRRLVGQAGLGRETVFSPAVQDRLADMLLREAGLDEATVGTLPRQRFMDNLAEIWAGLPRANGKSHYHGYAGNKATMSRARFDAAMEQMFPG